jgi:tetratricopeptide (TPR) repeat protein
MKGAAALAILVFGSLQAIGQNPAIPDFNDLSRRAAAALKTDPRQAAGLYRQALAMRPTWAEGWFDLGAAEYELKRYDQARQAFARAGELAPDNGAVWAFLGLTEYDQADYRQALTHILKAEELGLPDDPQFVSTVRIRAALVYMRGSDFTDAVEQLHALALLGDKSPEAIEALGVAALTRRWLPPGVPAAKRALVDLAGRAAWALYAQQQSEAEQLLNQLVREYPNEPGVHYLRGIFYVDRDPATAMKEFAAEAKVSPSNAMARVQIAILHLRTGEPEKALAPAREAVELEPTNLLCHLALGRALLGTGKISPATQEFEIAVKLNPAYPHTHFYLSQAYRQSGREEEARKEQEKFTQLKDAGNPTAGAGPPVK